jgi:hypothetical protein
MLLAPKDHLTTRILFKEGIPLKNHRRVRKLLELTAQSGFLHTDSDKVFGLVDANLDQKNEDVYEVVFWVHRHWELRHDGNLPMQVKFGEPTLPNRVSYQPKLHTDLARLLPGVGLEDQDR